MKNMSFSRGFGGTPGVSLDQREGRVESRWFPPAIDPVMKQEMHYENQLAVGTVQGSILPNPGLVWLGDMVQIFGYLLCFPFLPASNADCFIGPNSVRC